MAFVVTVFAAAVLFVALVFAFAGVFAVVAARGFLAAAFLRFAAAALVFGFLIDRSVLSAGAALPKKASSSSRMDARSRSA